MRVKPLLTVYSKIVNVRQDCLFPFVVFMSSPPSSGIGAKFLLVSAAIVVILAGIKAAQSLLAPFFLAVFLALILTPPLQWLKKKGLSDGIAILVLSTFVFLMGLGVLLIFTNSLTHFASKLPTYRDKVATAYTHIDDLINHATDTLNAFGKSLTQLSPIEFGPSEAEPETNLIDEAEDEENPDPSPRQSGSDFQAGEGKLFVPLTVEEWLADGQTPLTPEKKEPTVVTDKPPPVRERLSLSDVISVNTLISYVQLGVNTLLNIATMSSLVIIMVVFMLIEAARMPDKVREAFGGRDLSSEYFKKIADDTWNYMKIKTMICFLTGLSTSIGLWFLGIEYALLWGLLMFFLNYIPNIGQVIASIPPILLALIDGGLLSATLVTAWLIFVNTLFGIGVEPRYLGHGLDISSLVVLLSLIFWGWLLGPIGMFLSAPLTMVVKIVLQNDPKTRWLAVLLSNR